MSVVLAVTSDPAHMTRGNTYWRALSTVDSAEAHVHDLAARLDGTVIPAGSGWVVSCPGLTLTCTVSTPCPTAVTLRAGSL